jgi:hypothetical protein
MRVRSACSGIATIGVESSLSWALRAACGEVCPDAEPVHI